jgi:translation initiation factor 2 beta subunit (eIF-2beta)/eIF-5
MKQFETLRASTLYCRTCGNAMPVRERLLLVVPGKEIYDCLCEKCGESLGQREVTEQKNPLWTPR